MVAPRLGLDADGDVEHIEAHMSVELLKETGAAFRVHATGQLHTEVVVEPTVGTCGGLADIATEVAAVRLCRYGAETICLQPKRCIRPRRGYGSQFYAINDGIRLIIGRIHRQRPWRPCKNGVPDAQTDNQYVVSQFVHL